MSLILAQLPESNVSTKALGTRTDDVGIARGDADVRGSYVRKIGKSALTSPLSYCFFGFSRGVQDSTH